MNKRFFMRIMAFVCLIGGANVLGAQNEVPTSYYDTDRGFIHPGGLHTQADFDRIKQQLADGNPTVTAAYKVLKSAEYAQSGVQTYPVETIVRGGGVGENYINAARGATMAYQNALRWKIDDTKANADAAVRILMAWARTTKAIGGDSNYALAAGLYGYQFAQAAELMRDYEGWASEEFEEFKQWMLSVWYPTAIGFLRGRNGTWENSSKWWQAPGHYWSNWGLCNALCVVSIGVLCDDVYIYNQGMSYFKYDQVGNYHFPRTDNPIKNDGLTEFLGNLVVTHVESELETGAYGKLGQMNESGRDTGHSAMALGLMVDLAKVGWNQGDDLFAYMDHRVAAGIEFVAAQTQSVDGLPWTNYIYGTNGLYYTDSRCWVMTGPALGAQMRPYWGSVIGIYEGVKGVKMPFSENSYASMGIDGGGAGSTSGGYDHLGYSVLMNTRDVQLAPAEQVPTELTGKMVYSGDDLASLIPSLSVEKTLGNIHGDTICHNELGGLINTFTPNTETGVPARQTVKLLPQLPDGEEDTGLWQWETGETTRDITVTTDRSYIYRVTYTNKNGIPSQLSFAIAADGDCQPAALTPAITCQDKTVTTDTLAVLYGESATLSVIPACGWGNYLWSTGSTAQSITVGPVVGDCEYTVQYENQGGAFSQCTFHLSVLYGQPYIKVGAATAKAATEAIVAVGKRVELSLTVPSSFTGGTWQWSDGSTNDTLVIEDVQTSGEYTVQYSYGESKTVTATFRILAITGEDAPVAAGNYLIRHIPTDTYLTHIGSGVELASLRQPEEAAQVWNIYSTSSVLARYNLRSLVDSTSLNKSGELVAQTYNPFRFKVVEGTDYYAIYSGTSGNTYWTVNDAGILLLAGEASPSSYPFQLIPTDYVPTSLKGLPLDIQQVVHTDYFTPQGLHIDAPVGQGIVIRRRTLSDGTVVTDKLIPLR